MATCTQTIQSKIDSGQLNTIQVLNPNTLANLVISSTTKQLYKLNIIRQETVGFTISLVSILSPTNIGVTVNFFQISGNTLLFLGSALITEMILTFQKDFTVGEYIICISSTTFSYTGTFIGSFTGFPTYANLSPRAYTGQTLRELELSFEYIEKKCNKLLYFEIVDGKLPEGLEMTLSGNIFGILPNMDCTEDNDELSPSQNWYYDINETWQPWRKTMEI